MFRLESSYNCNKDFLEIREGNSTGPLVSRLCGIRLPSNYTSVTGHILWLRFRSDASVSGVGFQASFVHCECFEWQTLTQLNTLKSQQLQPHQDTQVDLVFVVFNILARVIAFI